MSTVEGSLKAGAVVAEDSALRKIALVGSPNSGKTTLYNWLTNSQFRTVNYPGATVDYSVGYLAAHLKKKFGLQENIKILDTPGIYSLSPKSEDEWVTYNCLFADVKNAERADAKSTEKSLHHVDAVVVVVDGTQLHRHLIIAEQLKNSGYPFLIAVTMSDILQKQDMQLDIQVLKETYKTEVVLFNGQLGEGLFELTEAILKLPIAMATPKQVPQRENLKAQLTEIRRLAVLAYKSQGQKRSVRTHQIDRWALHTFLGPLFFILIMFFLFSSVFWFAAPAMDFVDGLFTSFSEFIKGHAPHGLLSDFLTDGVVTGLAAFVVFTPQIFILFLIISLLEDSGYLARAATLIDKPFSKIGLSGRSFIPLLSGHACAIPAIMAARNLSSERDRKLTQFIIPLMSCSARLPVYGLLLGFLFLGQAAWKPGLAMTGVYLFSIIIGALVAAVIDKFMKKEGKSFLMMELPLYRFPKMRLIFRHSFKRTLSFIKNAGPMIFSLSLVMWALTTFPNYQEEDAHVKIQSSYAAKAGRIIEPIIEPMGGDWRVGFGLITAFAAREVFVPSMAIMFNVDSEDENVQTTSLLEKMSTATNGHGEKIFTTATTVGLIIFFAVAMQCMSTFAVYRRESGSLKLALIQLVSFNVLAYILAVAAVQFVKIF